MASIGTEPTELNLKVTKETDLSISFICTDSNGDPLDISIREFYFVARDKKAITGTKVIEILNAGITQSDSGTGTIDKFVINLTNALTDVEQRIYYYEIRSKLISGGNNDVWFNGTLDIQWTVQEVR